MATTLIRLADGVLVEVEVNEEGGNEAIAGNVADQVDRTVDSIRPLLVKVCQPVIDAWAELNKQMEISQAEVELGLSFEGQGNLYVTKATAKANFTVKLILRPPILGAPQAGAPS